MLRKSNVTRIATMVTHLEVIDGSAGESSIAGSGINEVNSSVLVSCRTTRPAVNYRALKTEVASGNLAS